VKMGVRGSPSELGTLSWVRVKMLGDLPKDVSLAAIDAQGRGQNWRLTHCAEKVPVEENIVYSVQISHKRTSCGFTD